MGCMHNARQVLGMWEWEALSQVTGVVASEQEAHGVQCVAGHGSGNLVCGGMSWHVLKRLHV